MVRFLASFAFMVSMLAHAAPAPSSFLPQSFSGWRETATSPITAPPADSAALSEYGLREAVSASYASGANRLTVQAWRFQDATGAYGAFTFFRRPEEHPASPDRRFVMWHGTTVIDASFAHPSRNDEAVLNGLAAKLPGVEGRDAVPPSLPRYLPTAGLDASTVRYAIGPVAYQQMGGVLPASDIGFSEDAEAVTARYGLATLTLIMYPTPQMAAGHLKAIQGLAGTSGLMTKRTGPLLVVASGKGAEAKRLLEQVAFRDTVTINRSPESGNEAVKVAQLLMGIAGLTGMLVVASLLVAFFLGGGRAVVRLAMGKPVSSVADEDFISLHLR